MKPCPRKFYKLTPEQKLDFIKRACNGSLMHKMSDFKAPTAMQGEDGWVSNGKVMFGYENQIWQPKRAGFYVRDGFCALGVGYDEDWSKTKFYPISEYGKTWIMKEDLKDE
jgi:hypothetical protein